MDLSPPFKPIDQYKAIFNVGATFDVCTGFWIKGIYGERILMGGLPPMEATVGPGKMGKSTIMRYKTNKAMARIMVSGHKTSCSTYDSEANTHINRMQEMALLIEEYDGRDVIDEGLWIVSDANDYLADEWYAVKRKFLKDKRKDAKNHQVSLPYNDKEGKRVMNLIVTFTEMDSLSAMNLSAGQEIMDDNNIGDSSGSHLFRREGLGKAQMLHELPSLATAARDYVYSTAHIGDREAPQGTRSKAPPKKQLQHLPTDTKIKGVTGQFLYDQHNLWFINDSKLLIQDGPDRVAKYPRFQGEAVEKDVDLNLVTMTNLRGNAGPQGIKLEIVLSQAEGVKPALTEFYNIKEICDFGFQGNDRFYQLVLLPEVTLQRTTVRQKLDEDKALRRAVNVTSEIAQTQKYHRGMDEYKVTMEQVYAGLKTNGYDIQWLLENTRGWWTYDNEKVGAYYLSSLDFVDMAFGRYHPYWMEADKKTVKKEFLRKPK